MSCVKISNASIDEGRLAAPSIEQSVEFQSAFPQWGLPRRGRRGRRGLQERQARRGQGLRQGWRGQGMLLELWQPGVRVRRRSRALAIGDASMGASKSPFVLKAFVALAAFAALVLMVAASNPAEAAWPKASDLSAAMERSGTALGVVELVKRQGRNRAEGRGRHGRADKAGRSRGADRSSKGRRSGESRGRKGRSDKADRSRGTQRSGKGRGGKAKGDRNARADKARGDRSAAKGQKGPKGHKSRKAHKGHKKDKKKIVQRTKIKKIVKIKKIKKVDRKGRKKITKVKKVIKVTKVRTVIRKGGKHTKKIVRFKTIKRRVKVVHHTSKHRRKHKRSHKVKAPVDPQVTHSVVSRDVAIDENLRCVRLSSTGSIQRALYPRLRNGRSSCPSGYQELRLFNRGWHATLPQSQGDQEFVLRFGDGEVELLRIE